MADKNDFLVLLENRAVQDAIHDLMKVKAPLLEAFEKAGQIEFYGNRATFYGTQPLPGANWKKDPKLFKKINPKTGADTGDDDDDDPLVFSQDIPIVLRRRYRSRSNYDAEKLAMEPSKLQELLQQIVRDITSQAAYELTIVCVKLLCTDDNYRPEDKTEKIDSALTVRPVVEFQKPEQVLKWMFDVQAYMCSPSSAFNKGYYSDTTKVWISVLNASYEEDIYLIIDPGVYNMIEESILADRVNYNLNLLKERFGKVIKTPLINDYQFIVLDKNAFAIRYVVRKGIYSKFREETLNTDYYFHSWVIAGAILYQNQAAWKIKIT